MTTKISLINLRSRTDRLDRFLINFKNNCKNYEIVRTDAVDGRSLIYNDELNSRIKPSNRELPNFRELVGCSLSHLKVYESIMHGADPFAFVFEDDATPLTYFGKIDFDAIKTIIPRHFNIIYLNDLVNTRRHRKALHALTYIDTKTGRNFLRAIANDFLYAVNGGFPKAYKLIEAPRLLYSTESYIISKAFAEHIYHFSVNCIGSADGTLFSAWNFNNIPSLVIWPPLFRQWNNADTDIQIHT